MKFQIVSDLHVDFRMNFDFCQNKLEANADYLLVAGDSSEYKASKKNRLVNEIFLKKWKNVYEVPGNHDNFGMHHCWSVTKESLIIRESEDKLHKHYYVNNNYIDIENVRLIFSTLWSLIRPENVISITKNMCDYSEISGYTTDINNKRHFDSINFIKETLANTPDNMKCIIITHHLPLYALISAQYHGNILNDSFASNCYSILDTYTDKIKFWIHGHSHDTMKQTFLNTTFIRNPLGYLMHGEGKYFNNNLIIEV